MDRIKSIAVPARKGTTRTRHSAPAPIPGNAISVSSAKPRRVAVATRAVPVHRYHVGETLHMTAGGRDISRAGSACQVTAVLPHETGPLLYRVRSEAESYERVVVEADLTPVE